MQWLALSTLLKSLDYERHFYQLPQFIHLRKRKQFIVCVNENKISFKGIKKSVGYGIANHTPRYSGWADICK